MTDGDLEPSSVRGRVFRRRGDTVYIYVLALALSVGTMSLLPVVRYTVLWTALLGVGAVAYLLGGGPRLSDTDPIALAWGLGIALLIGLPLLLVGSVGLAAASRELLPVRDEIAFQMLVFAIPAGETLFFRGIVQEVNGLLFASLAATLWVILLFLPVARIAEYPAVYLVMAMMMALVNFAYSYTRQRHGLAASWLCQVTLGLTLFFVPRLLIS